MPLRNYMAANELERVSTLVAFNVRNATRRKINQHVTAYVFSDGSQMTINIYRSTGSASHPAWKGTADDIHLGPIANLPLQVNR